MKITLRTACLGLAGTAALFASQVLAQDTKELPPELAMVKTLDEYLADTAAADPNFAGLYVDGDTLVIRVAGTGEKVDDGAIKQVEEALTAGFGPTLARFAEYPKRYEAAQTPIGPLLKAREDLVIQGDTLGITLSDVDERAGRIVIGLRKGADEKAFWALVEELGLPPELVELRFEEPAIRGADITDRVRPVVGGLKIRGGGLRCTLTAVVTVQNLGQRGFITNSHCSDNDGFVDGDSIKQPASGVGGRNNIGSEIADPPYTLSHPRCTGNFSCRYSDTLVGVFGGNDTSSLGRVARIGSWGSFRISGVDADYNITRLAFFSLSGERVTKIGAETGKTAGVVGSTCADRNVNDPNSSWSPIRMICQTTASSAANVGGGVTPLFDLGDSGSPVISLLPGGSNPSHNAVLHGVLWGAGSAPSNGFFYSSMWLTVLELFPESGPLDFF